MALISYYDTGLATVENGSRDITGTGTMWLSTLRENDVFVGKDGRTARIEAVLSNNALLLARDWPGDSQTSDVYEVRITPAPSEITASVRELLERLRQGLWLTPNATGTLVERAAFDSARRGFIYMQTDASPFVVFVKQTDTAGDWSSGFSPQQGPSGPFTTIEIGDTETLSPGSEATVAPVQVGDVVTLNFGIPAGTIIQAGATTTLAPDQPASVDFEPIPGGFELNFNIPRGPTGDIDGVTPFWVTRLGSDTDAASARMGLGLSYPLTPSTTNAENLLLSGTYYGQWTNVPPGEEYGWLTVNAFEGSNSYRTLEFTGVFSSATWHRSLVNGSWGPWRSARDASSLTEGLLDAARIPDNLPASKIPATLTPDKAFRRGNILGSVGQSGGVPTGAIIERGSNGNGSYVRYADGTQICWHTIQGATVSGGSSNFASISYPAAFVTKPNIAASPVTLNAHAFWVTAGGSTGANQIQLAVGAAVGFGGILVTCDYVAVGRWF